MLMPLFVLYIFMSIRTTLFLESANPVAVQLLLQLLLLLWFLLSFLFVVLLLQLLLPLHVMLCVCSSFFLSCTTLSSDCRAAASAAAAAARHAGCVCSSFFFWSCTTLTFPPPTFSFASGRSTQTSRICNALVCISVLNYTRRWRSISNKAIQSEVQLAGTCAYEVATHFSRCCSIWESVNLVALALFHGGTPILIQTWSSHLNAYASTCALHPNVYPNLAGRWRFLSNSAI